MLTGLTPAKHWRANSLSLNQENLSPEKKKKKVYKDHLIIIMFKNFFFFLIFKYLNGKRGFVEMYMHAPTFYNSGSVKLQQPLTNAHDLFDEIPH